MSNTAEVTDMTQLAIDQAHAEIEKALAEARKFGAENAKLLVGTQRLVGMLPHEIKKAEKEARWYGWVGASGFIALAIVFLMVLGKVLPSMFLGGHP